MARTRSKTGVHIQGPVRTAIQRLTTLLSIPKVWPGDQWPLAPPYAKTITLNWVTVADIT